VWELSHRKRGRDDEGFDIVSARHTLQWTRHEPQVDLLEPPLVPEDGKVCAMI